MSYPLTYNSNAKLLISGEYAVLDGACALAIPLNYGQSLKISKHDSPEFIWRAMEGDKIWFEAVFDKSLKILSTSDIKIANRLIEHFNAAKKLNPEFLADPAHLLAESKIDFHKEWGLGTSSTLISNVAKWAGVDPFVLHFSLSNGSGYDIACAISEGPILFQLDGSTPIIKEVNWNPHFSDHIYFVYLGKKQNSDQSVEDYFGNKQGNDYYLKKVSSLTYKMIATESLIEMKNLIKEHESLIAELLRIQTVKDRLFQDFKGEIKSLGAWGGDFVMVLSGHGFEYVEQYFVEKGLNTIFRFEEIIRKPIH